MRSRGQLGAYPNRPHALNTYCRCAWVRTVFPNSPNSPQFDPIRPIRGRLSTVRPRDGRRRCHCQLPMALWTPSAPAASLVLVLKTQVPTGADWCHRPISRPYRIAGRHQLDTVQLNWTVTYAYVATDPGGCRSGLSCGYVCSYGPVRLLGAFE